MGKATNFKFGRYIQRVHTNKSPLKIWEKRERAWACPGTSQIFPVPPIIPGTGKATNFKFGGYIQRVYATTSPLKIWERRERGLSRDKFFEYPLLSQECVKLRTSNCVRTFFVSIGTCNMCIYLFTLWMCCGHAYCPLSSIVDSSLIAIFVVSRKLLREFAWTNETWDILVPIELKNAEHLTVRLGLQWSHTMYNFSILNGRWCL